MRPCGTSGELERRRLRAMDLVKAGYSLNETARRMGCAAISVMRWRNAYRGGGRQALCPRPTPGRPPRLTVRQKDRLQRELLKGAISHGYRTDLWTTRRIADVIKARFEVRYHRNHIGRLLHALGWSCQKPDRRAIERDEEGIKRWKRGKWLRVKKTPRGWAPISSSRTNRDSC